MSGVHCREVLSGGGLGLHRLRVRQVFWRVGGFVHQLWDGQVLHRDWGGRSGNLSKLRAWEIRGLGWFERVR
jgi:hypothetical protein